MPTIALHQKYRPKTLAELVGQPYVQTALTNAIDRMQIAPAYLFTGSRGTGKTSTARIFAKSLNCLSFDGATDEPCGTCQSCRSIETSNSLDVSEIDAASNNDLKIFTCYVAEVFIEQMRQQQQQFALKIPAGLPPLVIDSLRLEHILNELLHNACKYTPSGEVITVSAQATSETIEICVSNSGVEISPIECDRIFDKFYRIPSNDPWKHGGTGLGLALVKKRVEHLGGQISVKSKLGLTQFIIQLPLCRQC